MRTKLSSIPFHTDSMLVRLSTYSHSRFSLMSYMKKVAFGPNNKLHPLCFFFVTIPSPNLPSCYRRMKWSVKSMTDGSSSLDASEKNSSGGTRLFRAIQSFQAKLGTKFKDLRKGLLLKIFFFLAGFYCATAFATVIGQTGDWDIISAGLAVVVVEGIGAVMYRGSFSFLGRVRSLIVVFNYWKAGLSLGLFLDSFKY